MNSRIAMILFSALVCCASSQSHAGVQQVMQSGADYVRVESQEANALPNAHPARVPPEQLVAFLSQLQFQSKGLLHKSDVAGLLTEPSIARLAPAISDALGRADAQQDITFAIAEHRASALGKDSFVTSGRIFVRDGELNLIAGEMVSPLRALINRRSQTSDSVLQPRAGYLSDAVLQHIEIEPGSRRRALSDNVLTANDLIQYSPQQKRKDWVVASLTGVSVAKNVETAPAAPSIQPAPVLVKPVTTESGSVESNSMEARLKRLKSLRDQGLISEESYVEKQRELLREL